MRRAVVDAVHRQPVQDARRSVADTVERSKPRRCATCRKLLAVLKPPNEQPQDDSPVGPDQPAEEPPASPADCANLHQRTGRPARGRSFDQRSPASFMVSGDGMPQDTPASPGPDELWSCRAPWSQPGGYRGRWCSRVRGREEGEASSVAADAGCRHRLLQSRLSQPESTVRPTSHGWRVLLPSDPAQTPKSPAGELCLAGTSCCVLTVLQRPTKPATFVSRRGDAVLKQASAGDHEQNPLAGVRGARAATAARLGSRPLVASPLTVSWSAEQVWKEPWPGSLLPRARHLEQVVCACPFIISKKVFLHGTQWSDIEAHRQDSVLLRLSMSVYERRAELLSSPITCAFSACFAAAIEARRSYEVPRASRIPRRRAERVAFTSGPSSTPPHRSSAARARRSSSRKGRYAHLPDLFRVSSGWSCQPVNVLAPTSAPPSGVHRRMPA